MTEVLLFARARELAGTRRVTLDGGTVDAGRRCRVGAVR